MVEKQPLLESKEMLSPATITGLFTHHLKSGRRVPSDELVLTPHGPLHDRELMAIDRATGTMLTQRKDPRLALIGALIHDDESFTLEAEGESRTVALLKEGEGREVSVHSTKGIAAIDQGDEIAEFASKILGRPDGVRVVKKAESYQRLVKPDYVIEGPHVHNELAFGDGAPLLLTSHMSLAALNHWIQLDTPGYPEIALENFRANIEVDGFGLPFAEDIVDAVQVGGVTLYSAWPSSRCEITTTNQWTGDRNPAIRDVVPDLNIGTRQPLYSLVKHRTGEYAPGKKGALFGENLIPAFEGEQAVIKKGDSLRILSTQH